MAYVTPDKYSPYPRVCDVCGQLRSINTMRKLDNITWVCDKHTGERTRIMLDTLNAHARPPQTWPNENPRPQNPVYPNILDASEGVLFNFIDQQVTNAVRYENVTAGDGAPVSGLMIQTMGWASRYLYDLIAQNSRPQRYITRATTLLNTAATALQARQVGFGVTPSIIRENSGFYGALIESGATEYVTNDIAAAGLAFLYAYRVLGTASYLTSARAVANYLRNVQAIGSNGFQFTSADAAGTIRLYTGAVCSEVSTTVGIDSGDIFYSNHLFYPSGLIALEFWKALLVTDGDQSIGCTGTAADTFTAIPAALMSTCMEDMRACWEDGIRNVDGETYTGLSSTTPREYFNAYPSTKIGFDVVGTGQWAFSDGDATTGTQITSLNFAQALSSLYLYEGASTQVTAIDDWLRSFDDNEDFATPDNTSPSVLARSTTGTYDPTSSLATILTVRDVNDDYAAIKINGSSLYDWGSFGLMAQLWASRHKTSFMTSRILPLGINQRYNDGTASDGLYHDYITLRGNSGLTFQTAFTSITSAFGSFGTIATTPDTTALAYWFEADFGVTKNASDQVTDWVDETGNGWDLHTPTAANTPPVFRVNSLNGKPGIYFGTAGAGKFSLEHNGGPFYTGANTAFPAGTPYPFTNTEPHVLYCVVVPDSNAPPGSGGTKGGQIMSDRSEFTRQLWTIPGFSQQRVMRSGAFGFMYKTTMDDYSNTPLLITYQWAGLPDLTMTITINTIVQGPYLNFGGTATTTIAEVPDDVNNHVIAVAGSGLEDIGFAGTIHALILDKASGVKGQTLSYLAGKYAGGTVGMVNDAVRASMYGRAFREATS